MIGQIQKPKRATSEAFNLVNSKIAQNCWIRLIQKPKRATSEAFKFSKQKGNSRSIQFQILENYRPTATLEAINLGYWKMEGLQPAFFI